MEAEVQKYLDLIKADYLSWNSRGEKDPIQKKIADEMVAEFNANLRVDVGNKYIKVVSRNSVHSFILKEDDKQFKKGDVLKAASWAAPARNFSRGNILKGTVKPTWTGVV